MTLRHKDSTLIRVSKTNKAIFESHVGHQGFKSINDVVDYAVKQAKLRLRKA